MTPPQTRAAARRVAARLLEGVEDAGQRLTAFARAGRPALPSAPTTEVVVTQAPAPPDMRSPPPKASAPPPLSAQDLSWLVVRHLSEHLAALKTATLHTDLRKEDGRHDPSAVRRVRISARRLRSFADLFATWIGRKRGLRIQHELRTITRVLGPLRDLDGTMSALAKARKDGSPLLRAAAEQLQATLAAEQCAAIDAAERAFADVDVQRLQRDLDVARTRVGDRLIEAGPKLAPALHDAFARHAETLFAQRPVPRTLEDMEAVHEVRITAKRLRYALEWMQPGLRHGPGPKRPLKQAQRVIGRARDLELRAMAVRTQAAELRDSGLTTLADALDPWLDQLQRDHARATRRVLPALDRLSPSVVVRLSQEALGCADPPQGPEIASDPV